MTTTWWSRARVLPSLLALAVLALVTSLSPAAAGAAGLSPAAAGAAGLSPAAAGAAGLSPAAAGAAGAPPPTTTPTTSSTAPARPALELTSVTPRPAARHVGATAPVVLSFSAPIATTSPLPNLDPSTAGSWSVQGSRISFHPAVPFIPLSDVTVTIPGGAHGIEGSDGARLAKTTSESFTVEEGSTTRLQQLLSILAYSPLGFVQKGTVVAPSDAAGQIAAMYDPPTGTFSWARQGWPAQLTSLWKPGVYNVFTRGLVMEFQADFLLDVTGRPSAGLWNDLLHAVAVGYRNTGGYDYALGNQTPPESLTIWHDGQAVLHVPANTGIAASPTPDGNFNVFARYRSQVMRGTAPDGQKYADPVQYVAYFHGGDAVHYLPRANYGIPQSLGCIELDLSDAAEVWPYLAYGTIVSVIG